MKISIEKCTTDGPVPAVFIKRGEVFANSRDVAEAFCKRPAHVLRDIDALITSPDLEKCSWFHETKSEVRGGKGATLTVRSFDLTRDGFTLLAMGWTGPKALTFKVGYINQFNTMEATLKAPSLDHDLIRQTDGIIRSLKHDAAVHRRALTDMAQQVSELTATLAAYVIANDNARTVEITPSAPEFVLLSGIAAWCRKKGVAVAKALSNAFPQISMDTWLLSQIYLMATAKHPKAAVQGALYRSTPKRT